MKFVGRLTELEEIKFYYENQSIKILVVSGMGGQGKTELVKKFIHQYPSLSPSFITWLNGDSYQQLMTSFQNLAQFLNLSIHDADGKPLAIKPLILQIRGYIAAGSSIRAEGHENPVWFIIIDNVDEEYSEFEKIMNVLIYEVDVKLFALITSRRNNILSGEVEQLELQTLAPPDAQQLIKNILLNSSDEDIVMLCEALGNHALALQQAGAYIRQKQRTSIKGRSYSIQDYLDEFKKTQDKILKHPLKLSNYDKTIHSIVQTTLDNIRNSKFPEDETVWTEEVGFILGLVNPDCIHMKFLHNFILSYITINSSADEWTEENTEAAILQLAKFSLVNVNNEIISLHRLVQAVLRLECDWKSNIDTFLNKVDFKKTIKDELFHLRSIWNHVSEYPEIVKNCPDIPNKIYIQIDRYSLVLELSEFALRNHALLAKVMGSQHESTLEMEYNVAYALYEMGEYNQALTTTYKVLDKAKLALGKDHTLSMSTSNQIAVVLYQMKKLDEALECHEKLLKSKQKVLGDNHKDTMTTRANMALVLSALGRRKEALSIYDEVLKWKEKNLGPSHPHKLMTRQNRAILLYEEGQLSEAKAEFEAVLELRIQVFGEEHVNTLDTKAWLAETLWKLGEKKKALEMLEEVLVGREKVLGMNHPQTEITRKNVSYCKMRINNKKD
jgi:tetratricopeptide (TPR) repeat protein